MKYKINQNSLFHNEQSVQGALKMTIWQYFTILLITLFSPMVLSATDYDTNLIKGGTAENSADISEWTIEAGTDFSRAGYSTGWAGTAPSNGGAYFFYGKSGDVRVNQTFNVTDISTDIDNNDVTYNFSGYYAGGYAVGDGDTIEIYIVFKNSSGTEISRVSTGVDDTHSSMEAFSLIGTVPSGTTSLVVTMNMLAGCTSCSEDADAYADNLSLSLSGPLPTIGTNGCSSPSNSGTTSNYIAFAPRRCINLIGGMKQIGNTVLCTRDSNGACRTNVSQTNNNYTYTNVNTDTATSAVIGAAPTNSSETELDLPTGATVKWAGLYWQSIVSDAYEAANGALLPQVYIKGSNNGLDYTLVQASDFHSIRHFYNSNTGYSGFADVTNIVRSIMLFGDDNITVANIDARQTTIGGLGQYGAWSLVVIYEDVSPVSDTVDPKLQNVSVYDGWQNIRSGGSANSVTVNVSGFLTPPIGAVNANVAVFVAEGDANIFGDTFTVAGPSASAALQPAGGRNPATNNAFNSSISGAPVRSPNLINNSGIDVQSHEVGVDGDSTHAQIFNNNETTASLTFTSGGDYYWPSMIAFAVDLYQPRVCYNQTFYSNGAEITAGNEPYFGDDVTIKVEVLNDDNASAEQVTITKKFDDDIFVYNTGSTWVQNVDEGSLTNTSDTLDSDLSDYNTTSKELTINLGIGADGSTGGTINPFSIGSEKAFFEYTGVPMDSNVTVQYTFDYYNPITGQTYTGLDLPQCIPKDNYFGARTRSNVGPFNVAFDGASIPDPYVLVSVGLDEAALYTQVAGAAFNVDVIAFSKDSFAVPEEYNGIVKVEVIDAVTFAPISTYYAEFNANPATNKTDLNAVVVPRSVRAARFKVTYLASSEVGGSGKHAALDFGVRLGSGAADYQTWVNSVLSGSVTCSDAQTCFEAATSSGQLTDFVYSRDDFSVRPLNYVITSTDGAWRDLLRAGRQYGIKLQGVNSDGSTLSQDYNQSKSMIGLTNTYSVSGMGGAIAWDTATDFNISNGDTVVGTTSGVANFSFTDVGTITVTVTDSDFANIDADELSISCGAMAGGAPGYGTNVCGSVVLTFIPDHFDVDITQLHNAGNGFTYISNDTNMSSRLDITITAENFLNNTTSNFSTTIGATPAFENPISIQITAPTVTSSGQNMAPSKIEIATETAIGFAAGVGSINWNDSNVSKWIGFNYPRTVNTPVNPFKVLGSTVGVDVNSTYNTATGATDSTANVDGTDSADENATFIYGRAHMARTRAMCTGTLACVGNVTYYYEFFGDSVANKPLIQEIIGTSPSKSLDSVNWYQNSAHNTGGGDGNITSSINSIPNGGTAEVYTQNGATTSAAYTYNSSKGYPYKATIELASPANTQQWLIYDKYNTTAPRVSGQLEYYGVGSWSSNSGAETTVKDSGTTHRNKNTNRRIKW